MDDVRRRPEWTMVGRAYLICQKTFWQFDARVLMPCISSLFALLERLQKLKNVFRHMCSPQNLNNPRVLSPLYDRLRNLRLTL